MGSFIQDLYKNERKKILYNQIETNNKLSSITSDKRNFKISKELNSILNGLILGDAGVFKTSPTSNARVEMSFGQKYQAFAEHIAKILGDLCLTL